MNWRSLAAAILGSLGWVAASAFDSVPAGQGSPRSTRNGGTRTGAAQAKREKRRRRNIAKRKGGAA